MMLNHGFLLAGSSQENAIHQLPDEIGFVLEVVQII
jgi:hypothetical protein